MTMKIGDYTNQGKIIWVDIPSPLISDPLIKTTKGLFRSSELTVQYVTQYLISGKWVDIAHFKTIIDGTRQVPRRL